MTFMMTSSNDDKSGIFQFFYQDFFHIVNTVKCKMDENFLRYSMFFHHWSTRFSKKPSPGRVKSEN